MPLKVQRGLLVCSLLLMSSAFAHAQLRPEVTSPPKQPSPAKPAQIVIQTSPDAQVYLDDVFKGQASAQGRLIIENIKPGNHALRITLAGKKDYEQQVTVATGQAAKVNAVLEEMAKPGVPKPAPAPSPLVVGTSPRAQIYLDDTFKGQASAQGRLVIENPQPGNHSLRVTLAGKKDFEQEVSIAAGVEVHFAAPLVDLPVIAPVPAQVTLAQAESELWKTIEGSDRAEDYQAYLAKYPDGTFAPVARARLDAIQKEAATQLEAQRKELAGSHWKGRADYTRKHANSYASPVPQDSTDKRHQFYLIELFFNAGGTCRLDPFQQSCTWEQIGDSVNVKLPGSRRSCREEVALTINGSEMSGIFHVIHDAIFSCGGDEQFTLQRVE